MGFTDAIDGRERRMKQKLKVALINVVITIAFFWKVKVQKIPVSVVEARWEANVKKLLDKHKGEQK
jgi:hypothetical protein